MATELQQFKDRGYVKLAALDSILIQRLRDILSDGLEEVRSQVAMQKSDFYRFVSQLTKNNRLVRQCVEEVSDSIYRLGTRFQAIERQPVGGLLFLKTHENPYATHAHQDITYEWNRDISERASLTTWIALDDCGPETGALSLLSGSHKGRLEAPEDYLRNDFVDRQFSDAWQDEADYMSVRAGEMILFDCRVWHAAAPVSAHSLRRGLVIRWNCLEIANKLTLVEPQTQSDVFVMYSSGRIFKAAIMAAFSDYCDPEDSLDLCVAKLLSQNSTGALDLPDDVLEGMQRFSTSLMFYESFQVKSDDTFVWGIIRDVVIPHLKSLENK